LAIGIGSGRRRRGNTRARRVGGLGFLVGYLDESIMKRGVGDDCVKCGSLNILGTRPKLIDDSDVAAVKRAKEEHYQQNRGDNHLATLELESEAIKTGAIFKERLGVTLNIVEDGKKGIESVRDRVGTTMENERVDHFKTPTMVECSLIFEQEPEGTTLHCETQLPLPNATSLLIANIRDEGPIGMSRGEIGHAEVELDLLKGVQKGFCVLHRGEFEKLCPNDSGRWRWRDRRGRGRQWSRRNRR
jgi:hypothetical protein